MSNREVDLIDETLRVWQPKAARSLSREDAREILVNMTGFFQILQEWHAADRAAAATRSGEDAAPGSIAESD